PCSALLEPIRNPSPTEVANPISFAADAANLANRLRQHCGTGISPDRDTTPPQRVLPGFARLCRRCRPAWPQKWRKTRVFPGTEAKPGERRTVCWRELDSKFQFLDDGARALRPCHHGPRLWQPGACTPDCLSISETRGVGARCRQLTAL